MFLFRTMRRSLMPRKTTLYIPSWGWPLLLVQRSRLLIIVITAVVLTMIIFLTLHMFQTVPLSKRLTCCRAVDSNPFLNAGSTAGWRGRTHYGERHSRWRNHRGGNPRWIHSNVSLIRPDFLACCPNRTSCQLERTLALLQVHLSSLHVNSSFCVTRWLRHLKFTTTKYTITVLTMMPSCVSNTLRAHPHVSVAYKLTTVKQRRDVFNLGCEWSLTIKKKRKK